MTRRHTPTARGSSTKRTSAATTGIKAPKAGTIRRVRLMSCDARQLPRPGGAQGSRHEQVQGPQERAVDPVPGRPGQCCGDDDDFIYRIDRSATNFTVQRGDRIAIRAKRTGTLRCGGGGDTLLFTHRSWPAAMPADPVRRTEQLPLLVEWQYK